MTGWLPIFQQFRAEVQHCDDFLKSKVKFRETRDDVIRRLLKI